MFSNYIKFFIESFHFYKVIIARFTIILFRRRKNIEELYFNYDTEHLFTNSYIIINYRFRNAIYYRFGKRKTLEKQIKIFDLNNIDKEIDFIVYGFFNRKKYKLKFKPKLTLDNSSFRTTFSNLNLKLKEKTIPKLTYSDIYCDIKKPNITISNIEINHKQLTISSTTFNQTDFI